MTKHSSEPLFLGIDVGTQGARVVIVTALGKIVAEAGQQFKRDNSDQSLPPGWFEQDPLMWWQATRNALRECVGKLSQQGHTSTAIQAISVTSTSGTIVTLDEQMQPSGAAIMYNDSRAGQEAEAINRVSQAFRERLGYSFSASFGLAKILWLKQQQPQRFEKAAFFVHATDFIIGKLSGTYHISDYSNALKSGYDIERYAWPGFIEQDLGISLTKLPQVAPPGTPIAQVSPACAEKTGLAADTPVAAGMTDGCTSQIAAGAVSPGDWNSTLGTTLVIKGVTQNLIPDPLGRIYSHRHPEGYWMPGGAGNVGGDCLEAYFTRAELETLNQSIAGRPPTSLVIYPLQKQADRFPIKKSNISGFVLGSPSDRAELYQGYLEGVGLTERLAYDLLTQLGASIGDRIYSAGGGSSSREWLQIRANILNKTLVKPENTGSAMGAAILAASKTHFASLSEAAGQMVTHEWSIEPEVNRISEYDRKYQQFVEELQRRGYLDT